MKYKLFICLSLLSISIFTDSIPSIKYDHLNAKQFMDVGDYTMHKIFNTHVNKVDYSFNWADKSIDILLSLAPSYNKLPIGEKFQIIEQAYQQLRYYLKTDTVAYHLYQRNIRLIADCDNHTYLYYNVNPNKTVNILRPKGRLIINDSITVTKEKAQKDAESMKEFKESITAEGHSEREILLFSQRIFRILTNFGIDYDPRRDDKVIVQAVLDEYNISYQEYDRIFRKHYMLIE
ncbi:hypothetical protein [Bacillus sp. 1P06AnD]|uniref:hypothetical protein n=1 Tax=Bacillus sp. 1P06AnD TaxID=3132208 RepID=UPI0039A03519